MMGYGWYGNGLCGNWLGLGGYGIWSVLIVIGLIALLAAIIIGASSKRNNSEALESLKSLYVKGDITEEEYLKRKNIIERKR
ncbi:conserved protein of unknown function [Petrocella atlantisensis]|uniref:SHOCT domain-containing protein n=1 Tax=Petrocella atlantisensis TaxID=2173034 RepID=A0A3P7Q0N0_9FIRM|nr:SHOCT domain-containing protein [Petrocella atlantisensis]VDN49287.1 conserved protein of unknown function [Petrocella atlantisensis]